MAMEYQTRADMYVIYLAQKKKKKFENLLLGILMHYWFNLAFAFNHNLLKWVNGHELVLFTPPMAHIKKKMRRE